MATYHLQISIVNGHPGLSCVPPPEFDPDPVEVDLGDTLIWELAPGLHWPREVKDAIKHDSGPELLKSLNFVNGTVEGTIIENTRPGDTGDESYSIAILRKNENGEEVMMTTHQSDDISFDPKIKLKPPVKHPKAD